MLMGAADELLKKPLRRIENAKARGLVRLADLLEFRADDRGDPLFAPAKGADKSSFMRVKTA